ncbi:hypothetical protein RIR_jg32340.t1 [Rhizophagus irregularis DAOM 181602=DAOM 197198]|nr:hypothetical protein RIR_jg32340.t1 [Rhizophagus irregularis DAOM 181602=DAOM 197198]
MFIYNYLMQRISPNYGNINSTIIFISNFSKMREFVLIFNLVTSSGFISMFNFYFKVFDCFLNHLMSLSERPLRRS